MNSTSLTSPAQPTVLMQLNRYAPALIIAGILALAAAITIGEWRAGTLGVSKVIEARAVVFDPQTDGTLTVHLTEASGATKRVDLPSASEGFVATIAKSLARDRRRFNVAETEPYRLSRFENGSFLLKDPVIGTEIRLEAFGPTNVAAFAQLLSVRRVQP
jgi:putative photosynthetic complex assembly protein